MESSQTKYQPDIRPSEEALPLLLEVLVPELGPLPVPILRVHSQHIQTVEDGQSLNEQLSKYQTGYYHMNWW